MFVTLLSDILPKLEKRVSFVCLYRFFVAVAFLFAQTLSVAHSHDHSDAEPFNQSCEICILAVNDDGDLDNVADQNIDAEDTSSFWIQIDRLALPEPKPVPTIAYAARSIDPPPEPSLRQDSARAPPLYI